MSGYGAYGVDLDSLKQTAAGIQDVLDELNSLGMHGEAESGAPIEQLALSSHDMGDGKLADGVNELLKRAHYHIRGLLTKAEATVGKLTDTRSTYQKAEDTFVHVKDSLMDTLMGNPMGNNSAPQGGNPRD